MAELEGLCSDFTKKYVWMMLDELAADPEPREVDIGIGVIFRRVEDGIEIPSINLKVSVSEQQAAAAREKLAYYDKMINSGPGKYKRKGKVR